MLFIGLSISLVPRSLRAFRVLHEDAFPMLQSRSRNNLVLSVEFVTSNFFDRGAASYLCKFEKNLPIEKRKTTVNWSKNWTSVSLENELHDGNHNSRELNPSGLQWRGASISFPASAERFLFFPSVNCTDAFTRPSK